MLEILNNPLVVGIGTSIITILGKYTWDRTRNKKVSAEHELQTAELTIKKNDTYEAAYNKLQAKIVLIEQKQDDLSHTNRVLTAEKRDNLFKRERELKELTSIRLKCTCAARASFDEYLKKAQS